MYNGSDSNTSAHVVGGSAHVVCTLVRVERMVLLQSLTSVPLPVWPLPDTELLPCVLLSCLSRLSARYVLWAYCL